MGLDLVVLAKEEHGVSINPTDAIGARRANRDDPEVMVQLRRLWESGDKSATFDSYVDKLVAQDVPPIVIGFGEGFESAKPAVSAEGQYYGFRGQAIEPGCNRVSAYAEQKGHDLSWLYEDLVTQAEIELRTNQLRNILAEYQREHSEITSISEQYYRAWQYHDLTERDRIEQSFTDPETEDHVFEVFSVFGAIDWLSFWADKGYTIAADY